MGGSDGEVRESNGGRTGLLCFSADWTCPVLWSHYAARHRGLCLGFDLSRKLAQTVRYEDQRILDQIGEQPDPTTIDEELQELLLCTKFRHWEYEQEIRMYVPLGHALQEGGLHFRSFDQDLRLAEVILGPQCNLSLDAVRELTSARYPNAVTFAARLACKLFEVVPQESIVS